MATATSAPVMSPADVQAHVAASYVRRPAPVMSDDLWRALGQNLPAACPEHRCWVDQCPAGAHGATAADL